MAQREGGDGLAERLGGISLESVGPGEAKPPIGPAGLIHKVRETLHSIAISDWLCCFSSHVTTLCNHQALLGILWRGLWCARVALP